MYCQSRYPQRFVKRNVGPELINRDHVQKHVTKLNHDRKQHVATHQYLIQIFRFVMIRVVHQMKADFPQQELWPLAVVILAVTEIIVGLPVQQQYPLHPVNNINKRTINLLCCVLNRDASIWLMIHCCMTIVVKLRVNRQRNRHDLRCQLMCHQNHICR